MDESAVVMPESRPEDDEDVVWGLSTATALWGRGERKDAIVWLRRASEAATAAGQDFRASEIGMFASDLEEKLAAWTAEEDEGRGALPPEPPPPGAAQPKSAAPPAAVAVASFLIEAPIAPTIDEDARPSAELEEVRPSLIEVVEDPTPAPPKAPPPPPPAGKSSFPAASTPGAGREPLSGLLAIASVGKRSTAKTPAGGTPDADAAPASEVPRPAAAPVAAAPAAHAIPPPAPSAPVPATAAPAAAPSSPAASKAPEPSPSAGARRKAPKREPILDPWGDDTTVAEGTAPGHAPAVAAPAPAAAPPVVAPPSKTVVVGVRKPTPAVANDDDDVVTSAAPLPSRRKPTLTGSTSAAAASAAAAAAGPASAAPASAAPASAGAAPASVKAPPSRGILDRAMSGVPSKTGSSAAGPVSAPSAPKPVPAAPQAPPAPPVSKPAAHAAPPAAHDHVVTSAPAAPRAAAPAPATAAHDHVVTSAPAAPRPAAPAAPPSVAAPIVVPTTPVISEAKPAPISPPPAPAPVHTMPSPEMPGASVPDVPRAAAAPQRPSVGGLPLDEVDAFADLPLDLQARVASLARTETLGSDEEVASFGAALLLSGSAVICATLVDAPASRAERGTLVPSRGTLAEPLALRVVAGSGGGTVAVWDQAVIDEALRDCPWVVDELTSRADRLQALAGATIGQLGDLEESARNALLEKLTLRVAAPGELVCKAGEPPAEITLVGAGSVEIGEEAARSGDFLFVRAVLEGTAAPHEAKASAQGALLLVGDPQIARDLLVSVPALVGVLSGQGVSPLRSAVLGVACVALAASGCSEDGPAQAHGRPAPAASRATSAESAPGASSDAPAAPPPGTAPPLDAKPTVIPPPDLPGIVAQEKRAATPQNADARPGCGDVLVADRRIPLDCRDDPTRFTLGTTPLVALHVLRAPAETLPAVVDHRKDGTEGLVRDAGIAPDTTALAIAAAIDHAVARRTGMPVAVSALQVWAGFHAQSLAFGLNETVNKAFAPEDTWTYTRDEAVAMLDPSACAPAFGPACGRGVDAEKLAATAAENGFIVSEVEALPNGVDAIKAKVAAGQDVIVALRPPPSLELAGKPGALYLPHYRNGKGSLAVLVSGYAFVAGGTYYLLHGSFGKAWGDGGYAWIHERTLAVNLDRAYVVDAHPLARGRERRAPRRRGLRDCRRGAVPDSLTAVCAPWCPDQSPRHAGVCAVFGQCPKAFVNLTGQCVLAAPTDSGTDPDTGIRWQCGPGGCGYFVPNGMGGCEHALCKISCPAPDFRLAEGRQGLTCVE